MRFIPYIDVILICLLARSEFHVFLLCHLDQSCLAIHASSLVNCLLKSFARFKKLDYFIIKFQDFPIFTSPFQILFLSQDVIFHLSNKYVLESKNVFWWSPIYWCLCFSDIDKKSLPSESHSVVSDSLQPHGLYSPRNSPGQNTGVDSLSLLQGIFPTQGSNPCLPHCRWILYHLSHQGSPRTLEWVAYLFSRGSSRPRNQTEVSCVAGGFFTSWATREAQIQHQILLLFSFRSCVILAFTFRSVIHFGYLFFFLVDF